MRRREDDTPLLKHSNYKPVTQKVTVEQTLQAQKPKPIPSVYVDCLYSHSHPQVVMCPLFCTPICCQIMVQAPISKPESLLFPNQVRQEGECNGEAVGRGLGWVGTFRAWPSAPSLSDG